MIYPKKTAAKGTRKTGKKPVSKPDRMRKVRRGLRRAFPE